MAKVLFVDDEPEHIASAVRRIESYIRGVKVEQVASVAAALEKLSTEDYDLVITDLMFGADPDAGYEVLARAYALKRYTPVIVVTSHGKDVERGVRAMMEGAFDYIRRDQGGIDDVALLAQKVAIGLQYGSLHRGSTEEKIGANG